MWRKSSCQQAARCKMIFRLRSRSAWSSSPIPRASRCRTRFWTPSTVRTATFPSSRKMCFLSWLPGSDGRTRAARRQPCLCLPTSAHWSWIRASTSMQANLTGNRSIRHQQGRRIDLLERRSGRSAGWYASFCGGKGACKDKRAAGSPLRYLPECLVHKNAAG